MAGMPMFSTEYRTPAQVMERARALPGMTFRDVLDLGISPEGVERDYNSRSYKGGMGTLIEERFFGYKANSDREPDFAEAGVELKATCYDMVTKRNRLVKSAGERLVLTMIPYDEEMPASIYDSHLWHKCRSILLVWYHRDKTIDAYDQTIEYIALFTPPEQDMRVIERDYALITGLVRDGRAEDLSESLTAYLGACTKGANAKKSMKRQSMYAPDKEARGRAFSFKRGYMDYVLHHYIMGEPEPEALGIDTRRLDRKSLAAYAKKLVNTHVGKTDHELCGMFGLEYTGNKAQRTSITKSLLRIRGETAAEFVKCGISVRTICVEPGWTSLKESFPIMAIDFMELAREEDWFESDLRDTLADMTYLTVVYEKTGKAKDAPVRLCGCSLWSVPGRDLDGKVRECWERTVETLRRGVRIWPENRGGKVEYHNDLPKISDELIAHVRPGTNHAAYRLEDGTEVGDVRRDGRLLPDGRYMTRQKFWLNSDYILAVVRKDLKR